MKGLEELKNIDAMYRGEQPATMPRFYKSYYAIEKELKALEIIKPFIKLDTQETTLNRTKISYFVVICGVPIEITKDQYDLLKEVLKNE